MCNVVVNHPKHQAPMAQQMHHLLCMLTPPRFSLVVLCLVVLGLPAYQANAIKPKKIWDTTHKIAQKTWDIADHTYRAGNKAYKIGKDFQDHRSQQQILEFEKTQDRIAALRDLNKGTNVNANLQVLRDTALELHTNVDLPKKVTIRGDLDSKGYVILESKDWGKKSLSSLPPLQLTQYYRLPEDKTGNQIQRAYRAMDELKRYQGMDGKDFYEEFQLQKGDHKGKLNPVLQTFDVLRKAKFKNTSNGSRVEVDSLRLALYDGTSYLELEPRKMIAADKIPTGAKISVVVRVRENRILSPMTITDLLAAYKLSGLSGL